MVNNRYWKETKFRVDSEVKKVFRQGLGSQTKHEEETRG